jgi:hypothetical protein
LHSLVKIKISRAGGHHHARHCKHLSLLVFLCASVFATEAVSSSHPATSYPADFLFYLDPCPYDDDYTFYVVITDLDDQFVAIGSGAGTAGFAMVIPDLAEFEDGLPDGVYKAWIGDSEDPYNESFSFAFAVLGTAALDGPVAATNVAATFDARDFFGQYDEFIVDLFGSSSTTLSGSFAAPLQENGYDFPVTGVVSMEYSLDGQDYTDDGLDFVDGSFSLDLVDLDDGPHCIFWRWMDVSGAYGYDSYCFVVDTTPPVITWSDKDGNPIQDGDTITDQFLEVTAGFWDEIALSTFAPFTGSLSCTVNGNSNTIVYTWHTSVATFFLDSGNYQFYSYELTATVTDRAGNITTSTITVHIGPNPPTVIAVSPIDGSWANTASPEIYAEFEVPSGGSLVSQTLSIDGEPVDSYISGNRVYASNPSLSEGTHTISVIAGNRSAWYNVYGQSEYNTYFGSYFTWSVGVDTVPPTLTSATITNRVLTVTGADATSGVSFVELQIDGCGGHFTPYALDGEAAHFDTSELTPREYCVNGTIVDVANNAYRFTATLTVLEDENEEAELADLDADTSPEARIIRYKWINEWALDIYLVKPGEDAWVGEMVALGISMIGTEDIPLTYQWHVPGSKVHGYSTSARSGTVTELTDGEANMSGDIVLFFWWKNGADNGSVRCNLTFANLEPNEASAQITVRKPTCEFSFESGTIYYLDNPFWPFVDSNTGIQMFCDPDDRVSLGGPDLPRTVNGIFFNPSISNFKSNSDTWATTQLIVSEYNLMGDRSDTLGAAKKHATVQYSASYSNSVETAMLDSGNVWFPLSVNDPGVKNINSSLADGDAPNRLLGYLWSDLFAYNDFKTYVMYRPAGFGSIFIPLKVCTWNLQFSVYRKYSIFQNGYVYVKKYDLLRHEKPPWEFFSDNNSEFDSSDPVQFPIWDKSYVDDLRPLMQSNRLQWQ